LLLGATFPEINAIIAWVYQHGNAPRRGRSPRGLRVVLPRSAARQQRCGARDDPGGENAGAHSACVGNRRSHVAVHGTPRDDWIWPICDDVAPPLAAERTSVGQPF